MSIPHRKGHPAVLLLALLASVALALGGWAGAQASARPTAGRHELTGSQSHQLLALVARARADAAAHKAKAVFSSLSEFTSYVRSLRASGSIDSATAVKLLLKARITESQAAAQLQISPASTTAEVDTTGTGTATAPAQPPQHGAQPQSTSETPPGTPQTATPVAPANQPATAQTVVAAITAWWQAQAAAGLHHGEGWHHAHGHQDDGQGGPGQSGHGQYGYGGQGSGPAGGGNS